MEDKKTRPQKRKRRSTFGGKSFTEALKEKYCTLMNIDTSGFSIDIVIHGRPRRKSDSSDAELAYLRNVVLSCAGVACAGLPHGGLSTLCPNVVDLDLSSNLLDDWEESLTIMSELPCLKFVNLSRNILINKENLLQKWEKPLPPIENLVLNHTGVPWEDIVTLSQHLPSLKELHVCNNGYDELCDSIIEDLGNINCLRLNNNRITSWKEVWKLRQLQNLQSLILSGNPLADMFYTDDDDLENHICTSTVATQTDENGNDTAVYDVRHIVNSLIAEAISEMEHANVDENKMEDGFHGNKEDKSDEDEEMRDDTDQCKNVEDDDKCNRCGGNIESRSKCIPFKNLKSLCLSETKLSDWDDLRSISQFPSLESVRIMNIDLLSSTNREERRKLFIANLPNIKVLNASEVTFTERDKAERHFLRYFMDKEPKPRRYTELENKHGKLTPLVKVDLGGKLKEFVALHFYHRGTKAFTHTLRVFEPVGILRLVAAEKLSLYASFKTFRLYHFPCGPHHDTDEVPKLEELILESLPMSRFDIMEGDQIHIDTDDGFTSPKGKLSFFVPTNYL